MAEILIAAISTSVALGALCLSWSGHRQQLRRAQETAERERRIEARDREAAERARQAERREALVQASLVDIRLRTVPSAIHDGYVTPQILVINSSSHPIRELDATLRGEAVPEVRGEVNAATVRTFALPSTPAGNAWAGAELGIDFTDTAGVRWRRDHDGGLRRGDGREGATTWGPREEPVIRPVEALSRQVDPAGPGPGFPYAGPQPSAWSQGGRAESVRSGYARVLAFLGVAVAGIAVAVLVLLV